MPVSHLRRTTNGRRVHARAKDMKKVERGTFLVFIAATTTSLCCVAFLLFGLLSAGPAFYNGQECRMTYSHFQFLPLNVPNGHDSNYRLLKFTDKRDPRHQHFYPISGGLIENYETQANLNINKGRPGRELRFEDNWCLLSREKLKANSTYENWKGVPYPNRGHPVLYVHGHWGSFSQARSLGAHGTRWVGPYAKSKSDAQIYDSLQTGRGMHNGLLPHESRPVLSEGHYQGVVGRLSKDHLDDFVMDVYSLDFNGEGAALHHSTLLRQADFFAKSIETLATGCSVSGEEGITVVAHSIGAWVVRLALRMHPHLESNGWVRNVVTLASPHSFIPYAVDASVHEMTSRLNKKGENQDVAVVSISGGLRDEMIPPEVCPVPSSSGLASKSYLASVISGSASKEQPRFGMDHRAIVWCYDLLSEIRTAIFSMVVGSNFGLDSQQRINIVDRVFDGGQRESYFDTTVKQHEEEIASNGYVKSLLTQLASLSNLNSILKLGIASGLIHSLLLERFGNGMSKFGLIAIPSIITLVSTLRILGAKCEMHECNLRLGTVYILAQSATLANYTIIYALCPISSWLLSTKQFPVNNPQKSENLCTISMQFAQLYFTSLVFLCAACLVFGTYAGKKFSVIDAAMPLCFLASVMLALKQLIAALCDTMRAQMIDVNRTYTLVLLLSFVKVIFGKVLYACLLIFPQGQDEMLEVTGNTFVASGVYEELAISSFAHVMPVVTVTVTLKVLKIRTRRFFQVKDNRPDEDDMKTDAVSRLMKRGPHAAAYILTIVLVVWYTWRVFVNHAGEDVICPLLSCILALRTLTTSNALSLEAVGVLQSLATNDLELHSDGPKCRKNE